MRLSFKKHVLPAAMLLAAVAAVPAHAAIVTFNYTEHFGSDPVVSTDFLATAVFDDGGSAGSVTLTITTGNIGEADITGMYFNLVNDSQATLDNLFFSYSSGESASSIDATTNAHKADGDGFYDIWFTYVNNTFNANETSVYDITGTDLTASDFNVYGEPAGPGNPGPFLSVARFQSTPCVVGVGTCTKPNDGSDWVGAVPVPAAVWLFGSGLLGMVGIARRKKTA